MKKFILVSLLLIISGVVSACNTIRGAGEDVEGLGRSMQRNSEY